ncbi:hypothetical protein J5N97_003255 [Dioscorea zingiberensis]|uniref:DUF7086 domain-containing protein n=1 Tax=Dioscorea zingiberensis TaxID=325984 RepID=A0A9D5D590_9LILI|nr:hypothetical protein J5N97_003255 [Dioscorea zingiberensis]
MDEEMGRKRAKIEKDRLNLSLSPPLSPPRSQSPTHVDDGDLIVPPYPWATNREATVHTLSYLLSHNITTISGTVQCKRCNNQESMSYELHPKFMEISQFIREHKHAMHDRAPPEWMNPEFPACRTCSQPNCMKPVISTNESSINWLFLLLGQTLGCCTLSQLKFFCKHTKNHRTGAKDRVLYLTYLALCKQLDPTGPFDIHQY